MCAVSEDVEHPASLTNTVSFSVIVVNVVTKEGITMDKTLSGYIEDARARMEYEAVLGAHWTFSHMSQSARDEFDAWLVKIGHVLASEAGTQERRFISFMSDLHTGRYRGELP